MNNIKDYKTICVLCEKDIEMTNEFVEFIRDEVINNVFIEYIICKECEKCKN